MMGQKVCQECWPDPVQPWDREHIQRLTHEVGRQRPPKPKCVYCQNSCYLGMNRRATKKFHSSFSHFMPHAHSESHDILSRKKHFLVMYFVTLKKDMFALISNL